MLDSREQQAEGAEDPRGGRDHDLADARRFLCRFRGAACRPSSITARIAELERILDAKVFLRSNQQSRMTARGRAMFDTVGRMLRLSDEIAISSRGGNTLRGLLRLGAVESVALLTLPRLLPRLIADYPDLKVQLTMDVGISHNRKPCPGQAGRGTRSRLQPIAAKVSLSRR